MRQWISTTIRSNQQANEMLELLEKLTPSIGAFDTETSGLHIIQSTPFLFQFGYLHPTKQLGYTYAVDLEKQPHLGREVILHWHNYVKTNMLKYLAHNVKYDLHMLKNYGLPYTTENLSDSMFYIRYAHDAVQVQNGGPPLALKDYASQYIDHSAKYHEKLLKNERSSITKELNLKLKGRLKGLIPPAEWEAKAYTLGVLEDMFKDPISDWTWLPEDAQQAYQQWLNTDVPEVIRPNVVALMESEFIPYNMLDRETLLKYAHLDIVYALEIYDHLSPIVAARGNELAVQIEESLIIPLWEMERTGFSCDTAYVLEAQLNVREYIQERRQDLYDLCQRKINIGQHALVKSILEADFNVPVTSTNADVLDIVVSDIIREGKNPEAVEFINIIQELRTLEKWYSAYIMRFVRQINNGATRLYTTINQVGAVTGRVTSDFQQFPKVPIFKADGAELFNPRRMVICSGGKLNSIIYLDYSQIELRFQAFYTILVGHPDLNLCRAYMPYKCVNSEGVQFDYQNPTHIKAWAENWYLEEDPAQHWEPTDVHGATTMNATGLTPDHPDFKTLRTTIGKKVNFAKNYGAQLKRIRQMFPDSTEEEVIRIDASYYNTFPGVKEYHNYCYGRANMYSHTENLFGIKYYGVNGHKLINSLVQGSAAFYLKKKIREVYDYFKENNIQSKFQMNIHDELSWEVFDGEEDLFFQVKHIMEDWPDALVPIVADMDITNKTWADKKGVNSIEEINVYLGH